MKKLILCICFLFFSVNVYAGETNEKYTPKSEVIELKKIIKSLKKGIFKQKDILLSIQKHEPKHKYIPIFKEMIDTQEKMVLVSKERLFLLKKIDNNNYPKEKKFLLERLNNNRLSFKDLSLKMDQFLGK